MLEEGAQAEVWENYGAGGRAGLFNGVTEIVLGNGANLRYVCKQALPTDSWVFATQRAEIGPTASLEWVALGLGPRAARCEWRPSSVGGARARR